MPQMNKGGKFIFGKSQVKLIKGYCQKTSLCQSKK